MATNEKVLIVLDDDGNAADVAQYVGRIISGEKRLRICLLHIIPPLPPELQEFRGAEDPKKEQQLDRELDLKCEQWNQDAAKAAQVLFQKTTSLLTHEGVTSSSIDTWVRQSTNHENLTDDILDAARERECRTIVVGRSSFPWLKDLFHRHVADELVKKATGVTIWVVEENSPGS